MRGRITGFGARVLDDSLPKYVNSPQTAVFDKSGTLYSINLAAKAIRQQDQAVIVEGYMDVITAHQNGFNNVVASMGTAITDKQVLALDADAAGEEATLRSVDYENTLDAEMRVIVLPQGKDPDDVIKEDIKNWQTLLDGAVPVVDYTLDTVIAQLDMTTARDKAIARDKLLPIVARIKDIVRQSHYTQRLARLLEISGHKIEQELERFKHKQVRRRVEEAKPAAHTVRRWLSNPEEEYCLTLLLQHPELKRDYRGLSPEFFESTENREIFTAWQQAQDIALLKESLDPTIHEHIDYLVTKAILPNQIERKFADCVLRLRKGHLRNLKEKMTETAGVDEADVKVNEQLREVFTQERRIRSGQKEVAR
jgi:DNA primase